MLNAHRLINKYKFQLELERVMEGQCVVQHALRMFLRIRMEISHITIDNLISQLQIETWRPKIVHFFIDNGSAKL